MCSPRALVTTLPAAAAVLLSTAAPAGAAAWTWPLAPPHEVVHGFAPPAHDWLPGDRGVDLAAAPGEAVVAAGAGRVAFAGRVGDTDVVVLRHADGLATTYEPVRPGVRVGQVVGVGQRIGHVVAGWARCRPRTCLHWGLKRDGSYLDPLGLVGAAQIRLLPADGAPASAWWPPATAAGAVMPLAFVLRRRRLSRGRR